MVLGEMLFKNPNSTAFCASRRTVQWSWPSGDGLQATAMRWAVCKEDEGTAPMVLHFIMQDSLHSSLGEPLTHVGDCCLTHIEGGGKSGGTPSVG